LEADEIGYVPKGVGSYHWMARAGGSKYFITVDDLDTKPWIGRRPDLTFGGLAAAYQAAWVLHHEARLAFVVAPLRRSNGSTILRLSDQYTMAVFPFVEGHAGISGDPLTASDRPALLQLLARLHRTTTHSGVRLSRRPLDLPERPFLAAAMSELDRPWKGGPLSEPARHALAGHARDVTSWLEQLEVLAQRVRDEDGEDVLTHGEPHLGNLIHTPGGLRLVDWDTVALARPERDLWMLLERSPGGFALYEDLTGRTISDTALSFYQLAWTLSDIASFANMFRSPHDETRWVQQKWRGFQGLLGGLSSAPFGVSSERE